MGGILGSPPPQQVAATPVVAPPPTMPDSQSPGVLEAKRRAQQDAMSRAGRTSTILSRAMAPSSSGAPQDYSSKTTGAA